MSNVPQRMLPLLRRVSITLSIPVALILATAPAYAGSNTYPTSIGGCTAVTPPPSGSFTCNLAGSTPDIYFDQWKEENRECTSYAAWMLSSVNGFTMPFYDYATNWKSQAQSLGYVVNSTPANGSIYWQLGTPQNPYGHVAYVENISTDGSQVQLEDYNHDFQHNWAEYWTSTSSASGYIHFKDISSGLGGGGASSWSVNRLDAWVEQAQPTGSSNLGHIWYDGAWHPWENIPNNQLMTSQPAAVSWGLNRIDVFARGQAGDLIHQWYNGTSWSNWESLGGCIVGPPTVTSWGPNELDVFAEGCGTVNGSNLVHTWYNSVGWNAWETVDSNMLMTSAPSAVAWAPGRIDIFAQGPNQNLIHTWYNSAGWNNWENLGGCIVGAPAASSWGPNRLDGWVEGCNTTGGNFYHIFWDGSKWNPFELVNSTYQISGVFGAVSWGYLRIDMYTRASDNSLDHWWYNTAGWNGPENKGGAIAP